MDPTLKNLIFEEIDELKEWTQELLFVYDESTSVDLSCAVGGKNASTPKNATNQPKKYPRGTVYRFDPNFYRGQDKSSELKKQISEACEGCSLCHPRGCRQKGFRQIQFDFNCSCYLLQKQSPEFEYGDELMAKRGIKEEHVKRRKTAGERKGVDKMAKRKISKSARMEKQKEYSDNQPEFRRTNSSRAFSTDQRCKMSISVFMDHNGFWYLSTVGNLHHNDHTFIPRDAEIVKEADVSEKGKTLMQAMHMAGIENSKIADVMSNIPDGGGYMKEFMRKTAENMCTKMKTANDLLQGVTADMSTAEKAIKYCERYVYN